MTESNKVLRFLASAGPHANTTAANEVADEIMLQTGGNILSRGCLYDILCQPISPNVCKLSLSRSN